MAEKPKILVVDDNAANRALARATLDDEGYDVIEAADGEAGIQAFQAHHPDCILLDVRMPGTDGLAACARIRALPGGADVPIVFLTALRDLDTFDQALAVGGDDFLNKPVRPNELLVRVQSAVKLRRMSADLREHYDLVRHQRDDLMRLQLQKERLTAFVVHDLKSPVTSMDLLAQSLVRDKDLSPRARESAQHIRDEARSLLRLILNLLDISKSEEGRLTPRLAPVKLEEMVGELFEALELRARTVNVTLEKHLEVDAVTADADLLRRVLENLIDNALRHAPERTAIRLSAVSRGSMIEIRVADSGSGVPHEMREHVFDRFVQGAASERVGRGLGLAFCKLAVEAQGGAITLEEGNPGAVFCVRLS